MQKVCDAAYAAGVQDAENRQHGIDDFIGTDGKPTWEAVALFSSATSIASIRSITNSSTTWLARTAWGREPTERQHKYLHSLFFKLGGKIT